MKKLLFSVVVVAFVVAAHAGEKKAEAKCCAAKAEASQKAQCPAGKAKACCAAKGDRQTLSSPKAGGK